MNWSDVGRKIVQIGAPLLGTVIGGPAGMAAGGLVASYFGANPEDPDDIINKINADPDAGIKLLKIQSDERINLEKLSVENFRLEIKEKQSARNREVEMARSGHRDYTTPLLAFLLSFGFLGLLWVLIFCSIQKDAMTIVEIMVGILGTAWIQVIQYYFGSSKGSKDKDAILASKNRSQK